ncbi:protein containing PKD domain protein [gut metagenome]|uniref:Protein containing PKD domain protein n=1 Tax=gut metagenome TaxID=749906 RepID=J9GL67_9ZZZZ
MKEMKHWVSSLFLTALLTLPFIMSSCDDDDPFTGVAHMGIEDGATVNVGEEVELEAQLNLIEGDIAYRWTVNGEEVETDDDYTFVAPKPGSYSIELTATGANGTFQKSITLNAQMYKSNFFVINEGQYGKSKGSLNKYSAGEWTYNYVKGGFGKTSTMGEIHGEYMYVVSKEEMFLAKVRLSDGKIVDKLDRKGVLGANGQGNSFCIANDEYGVLTSTNGAFKVNLNDLSKIEKLSNMNDNLRQDKEDICKVDDQIFIITKNKVKVYNAADLTFKKELSQAVNTGFALSKDGSLWAANDNKLVKINVKTLDTEEITLPDGLSVYYNSMAYTPSGLSASTTENALYFAKKTGEGWSIYGKDIYKYDIDQQKATEFFEAPEDDKSIYGAGVNVNSNNGDVYIVYTEDGWGDHYKNTNIYVADGQTGHQKAIIDYSGELWFPSKIVFN